MEGIPTIGPKELAGVPFLAGEKLDTPPVPFSNDVCAAHKGTHILVFTPRIKKFTLVGMREAFGTDPSKSEPCMYDQDWYLKEEFASLPPDGKWHLVRKEVLEDARAKEPTDIEKSLSGEVFPKAVTLAFTFFVWHFLHKEALWKHDFLWCSDLDHNGDRVYVGRYEDPTGVNKNGFNIHRHLSLRPAYSAAPEVR
jgi:hypothetical protein